MGLRLDRARAEADVVLAALVLLLGLALAIPVLPTEPQRIARDSEVGDLKAMQKAREPGWALLNPFIGAGVEFLTFVLCSLSF